MESRKRVEQRGRFTITEIIPGSPYSPRLSSPTFQDDVSVADFPVAAVDDAPASNGSCSDVATIQPQPAQLNVLQSDDLEKPLSNGAALPPPLSLEEPPETHTQPPEAVSVPPAPIEATLTIVPQAEPSSIVDTICEVSTPTTASAASTVTVGSAAPGSPSRKFSSPKKSTQRARRVKRRGRFTIIELASDSPTSRKNSDDLYDHRFVTTTSIGGSSVESAPQLGGQLSRSFDSMERRPKPKRATRSMPRLRQNSSIRRSRRRSESPDREFIESTDMVDPSGNQQQQQEAAVYAKLQALPVVESADALVNIALTTGVAASTATTGTASSGMSVSMGSVVIPDGNSTTVAVAPSTVAAAPSAVRPVTPPIQLMQVAENSSNAVNLPQSSITISAAQFLQQQQTIASLIRQQHDLKQIIRVLQEQQQQLMTIPSQINELRRQRAGLNNSETPEEELRELYRQVDTLSRSNESLQSLLNAAEREARHHTLEIECLSEENDELRHRCGQLESRYIDERKQSFMLEEELQRLRIMSLTQQEQQLRQQQQRNQKLN
ncbi:hypothetical protein PR003_g7973 [Phytophthora rubi]|uniref:Uncharacterized protein n=1 Tax=Phytophthora rubi TaxID=129364 RepID=A0A6A3N2B8_9STRA|nr:hypothetical protein PR002_g7736 [Phytophthora rubi]KAE9039614.1 hypothetical protein PR001_g7424 [Phytophthora rubi]KAE9345378.1 hypothetical protein PR003_g7973 [Phytophthora rubi]